MVVFLGSQLKQTAFDETVLLSGYTYVLVEIKKMNFLVRTLIWRPKGYRISTSER